MAFKGFGSETLAFLYELSQNNNKTWFADNKERYASDVLAPAEAFVMSLGPLLAREYPSIQFDTRRNGAGSVMRIHRDLRFSTDRRPYKENLGIIFPLLPGKKVEAPIFYFHIEAGQAFFYGGQHVFNPEILERFRKAVDHHKTGPVLEKVLGTLADRGLRLMEEPRYKRVPRSYPADHPRAGLLCLAALGVGLDFGLDELGSPELIENCYKAAGYMKELMAWLLFLNA